MGVEGGEPHNEAKADELSYCIALDPCSVVGGGG